MIKASYKSFDAKLLWDAINVTSEKGPNYSSELHAEELNDHFIAIAKKITGPIGNDTCNDQIGFINPKIFFVPHVTPAECIKYLLGISSSILTGFEAISV